MMINLLNVQAKIYERLPKSVKVSGQILRLLPDYLTWRFNKRGWLTTKQFLQPLKGKYAGYRCVVIGNGPSLKKLDLSVLRNEFTFGSNRIYLLFNELGFETDFLVSVNRTVIEQFRSDLTHVKGFKFLNWRYRSFSDDGDQTYYLSPRLSWKMDGDIINGYFPGIGTVTNVSLELAFFLGFSEVVLIGVDHNYSDKGTPNLTIVSNQNDTNHFSPNYFGKGVIWQLPDYLAMEEGYLKSLQLFSNSGRNIVDATVDGKLQIFPKVDFFNHLSQSKFKNKLDHETASPG
jgi:hypothetical protein